MSDSLSVEAAIDGKSAFREAYAAAEVEAAKEAGLLQTEETPEQTEPPRDEQGRFTTTEPEPAETADERDARIAQLEQQLAEKESFIGRQSTEIGQLRQTVEERLASYDERLNQQPRRQITTDFIEQNPAAATQTAFEQGDQHALAAAYEQWQLENPAAAAVWLANAQNEQRLAAERAQWEQRYQQLEQRVAPLAAQTEQQQLANGVAALPQEQKDFLANQEQVSTLAAEYPALGRQIAEGSPSEKLQAVKALFDIHRGRTADTLTRTEQEVARATALEAQQVRDEAFVASSTTSQETPKTREQIEQDAAVAAFTRGRTLWDGAFEFPAKR